MANESNPVMKIMVMARMTTKIPLMIKITAMAKIKMTILLRRIITTVKMPLEVVREMISFGGIG